MKTIFKISIITSCILFLWFVILPTIYYESWGYNEHYYYDIYELDLKVECDFNFLSEPTNCRYSEKHQKIVDILSDMKYELPNNGCYEILADRVVPCTSKSGNIWELPFNFLYK